MGDADIERVILRRLNWPKNPETEESNDRAIVSELAKLFPMERRLLQARVKAVKEAAWCKSCRGNGEYVAWNEKSRNYGFFTCKQCNGSGKEGRP